MHVVVYINGSPRPGSWSMSTQLGGLTQLGGCSITGAGTKYSPAQIVQLLRQAGWPDVMVQDSDGDSNPLLVIMTAICLSESGGWSGAENHCGENSIGLFQVNLDAWSRQWNRSQLLDPLTNAQAALAIYNSGQGLSAWGPYTSGIYSQNMPAAWSAYGGSPAASSGLTIPPGLGLGLGSGTAIGVGTALALLLLVYLVAD